MRLKAKPTRVVNRSCREDGEASKNDRKRERGKERENNNNNKLTKSYLSTHMKRTG